MTKRLGGLFKGIARFLEGGKGSRGSSHAARQHRTPCALLRPAARAAILSCALFLPALPATAQHLENAGDLARTARESSASGRALLVLFSEKDCVWCERTRREFLLPMQRNPGYREKLAFVQVNVDSDAPLTDFRGRPSTHAALARQFGVKLMPTVMLLGRDGEPLAEALVGFTGSDYYGYYLDQRIDSAVARVRKR